MEQKVVLDLLSSKLSRPSNLLTHSEVKNEYDKLVTKIKNGTADIDDPLNDLDKAIKSKTKKSIKEKTWFTGINEQVKAVCRQKEHGFMKSQQETSSNTKLQQQMLPSSPADTKQKQTKGTYISKVPVTSSLKGQSGKQPLEGSIHLLQEVCNMINCQVTYTYTDEGIYQLAVGIKSKINEIESQCVDVSKQVKSMQDAFGVQQEGVNGGIKCIPLWNDALRNILKMRKSTKDQNERDADSMNEQYRLLQKENLQKELQNKNEKEQRDSVRDKAKQTTDDKKINYKETSTKKVNEKFDYLETELAQEKDKNKKLRNDIHTKHEEIIKLKDNVDYWKNRVSKLAGSKLTDNNPGVTDLSDPNRPTRLAEMFNEIYDNVWTDTLEGLNQPKQIATEKKAVEHMASILKVCYDYCANKFQDTLIQVEKILLLNFEKNTDEELYKEECKQLKDMLKLAGVRTSKGLNQDMAIKSVHDPKLRKVMETYKDVTEKFTKQCLEICWLMAVQDPQVVLHWGSLKEGSSINSDHFKCFTRSGTLLEYVVWPAMLLHKDGPFLSKGIVQPLATTNTSTRL